MKVRQKKTVRRNVFIISYTDRQTDRHLKERQTNIKKNRDTDINGKQRKTYRHIHRHIFKGKKDERTERKTDRQIEHKTFVHSWVKQ
jgi:hypothetical protein